MAEDEDGVSDKKSSQNSNNGSPAQDAESGASRPDLGIEDTAHEAAPGASAPPAEPQTSTAKTARKEENPFSFRHFLKRDLSLPGTTTYESTGARPKVYASTVQHSPTRRPEPPAPGPSPLDTGAAEIPFSVNSSESKDNPYSEPEVPFYHRPNLASEPLGLPSLPDFVQDHILVEQAYLNSDGPISVDLDNLPDFTFNTNFNAGSSSLGRRNNANYGSRDYDYDSYMSGVRGEERDMRELAVGAEAVPLDLPPHLNLDLTQSVNPADRRNMSPRNTFPLDLPPNAGESVCLPDFLPVRGARSSPEPAPDQLQIMLDLEQTRAELFSERTRRCRLEREVAEAREQARALRDQLAATRAERERPSHQDEAAAPGDGYMHDATARPVDAEDIVTNLKKEIKRLKEELAACQSRLSAQQAQQGAAAADLRRATSVAEISLRDLLAGLEQLKSLSTRLDPT